MTSTDAARSFSITGRATLTTDSSILAVAEAKIVANRTHDFCRAVQSAAARVERMTPSSQGAAFGLSTIYGPRASSAEFAPLYGYVPVIDRLVAATIEPPHRPVPSPG